MISATRNKVKWEREEGKGRITPLILGNSGFYFILFLRLALLLCAKKTKGAGVITMAVKAWFKLR